MTEEADVAERQPDEGPWWGQVQKLVWTLGPVTVAFFLFFFVNLGWLPSPMLEGIQGGTLILKQNQKTLEEMQMDIKSHVRNVDQQQGALLKALRQICRNTAKNPEQNYRCDEMTP